jgi:hypothetical protein
VRYDAHRHDGGYEFVGATASPQWPHEGGDGSVMRPSPPPARRPLDVEGLAFWIGMPMIWVAVVMYFIY